MRCEFSRIVLMPVVLLERRRVELLHLDLAVLEERVDVVDLPLSHEQGQGGSLDRGELDGLDRDLAQALRIRRFAQSESTLIFVITLTEGQVFVLGFGDAEAAAGEDRNSARVAVV